MECRSHKLDLKEPIRFEPPVSGMESCCSFTDILNSSSARSHCVVKRQCESDLALLGNWDNHLAYLSIRYIYG